MDLALNTRNTRRLGIVGLATLFALLSGCFTEPVGGDTGATGGDCDEGSFGCECLDGICEPNLVCNASNQCVPAEDCTPGTMNCACDELGRCAPGLECTVNGCFEPSGTTVTPTSTESNTGTDTSTTGTSTTSTTMPTDTMPSTTSADTETSTTDPDTTDTGVTTGAPLDCPESEKTCAGCFSCTEANECEPEQSSCDDEPGCVTIVTCMQNCAIDGLCFDDCCEGENPGSISAALDLQTCREDTCIAGACRSYATFTCN